MIDLKSIHDMWKEDCMIDEMKLDESSRQAPILHAKYLELLSTVIFPFTQDVRLM